MIIHYQRLGSTLRMSPEGRIDTLTAPELDQAVQQNLDGVTLLILDLAEVNFISSAGLRVLLSAQKRMNRQGTMIVEHVCPAIMEVLEMTGFAEIMDIRN